MAQFSFAKLNKNAKIGLVMGAILVVLLLVFLYATRNTDVEVQIVVVPEDAALTLDGQPVSAGKVVLKTGEHTIKGTRKDFTDDEVKVNTKDLKRGDKIYVQLGAETDAAFEWLANNPGDPQLRQELGDERATQAQEKLQADYPWLGNFPHESLNYKIDYSMTNDNVFKGWYITLYTYARPGQDAERKQQLHDFKAEALKYMTDKGVDIKKYPITYDPAEAKDL